MRSLEEGTDLAIARRIRFLLRLKRGSQTAGIILVSAATSLFSSASPGAADALRATAGPGKLEKPIIVEGESAEGPSSVGEISLDLGQAGEVIAITRPCTIVHKKGNPEMPKVGSWVMAGDTVETGHSGKIEILLKDASALKDKSKVLLNEMTRVVFTSVRAEGPENLRDVRLELLAGQLRSTVMNASDPVLPTFRIQTPTALARVRSGDFVFQFEAHEDKWNSVAQVFDGKVQLGTDRSVDGKTDAIEVVTGEEARFSSRAVEDGSSGSAYQVAINQGEFSKPQPMDQDAEVALKKTLDYDLLEKAASSPTAKISSSAKTKIRSTRAPSGVVSAKSLKKKQKKQAKEKKPVPDSLCVAPSGEFNQCSWTCEGHNPKSARSCRSDLPGVACVRRICRANGAWTEETRLPASQSEACAPKNSVVHDCGTYW